MNKKFKNQNGITLIALVITIIVMLILVAVTINMAINGGLFTYAGRAASETTIEQDREKIQLCVMEIMMKSASDSGEITITKNDLEEALSEEENIIISDKRPEDEYMFIVTLNERQYGIKENNEVEYLTGGIYNKYINVTYVGEESPKYLFENTVTQEDVDNEVNGSNVPYTIVGVLDEESGEYKTEGTINGKSGELNIIDLQNANFEYTLKDFFDGDDSFYVKILINGETEKEQKLTVVQGDVVRYEENFMGIEYTGEWTKVEDANCSGGACYVTEEEWQYSFYCTGSEADISTILHTEDSVAYYIVYRKNENETNTIIRAQAVVYAATESVIYDATFRKSEKYGHGLILHSNRSYINAKNLKTANMTQAGKYYLDSIIIYK